MNQVRRAGERSQGRGARPAAVLFVAAVIAFACGWWIGQTAARLILWLERKQ